MSLLAPVVLHHVGLLSLGLVEFESHLMIGLPGSLERLHKLHGLGAHPLDRTLQQTHSLFLLHLQVVVTRLTLHRQQLHLNFQHVLLVRDQEGLLVFCTYHVLQLVQVVTQVLELQVGSGYGFGGGVVLFIEEILNFLVCGDGGYRFSHGLI